MAVMGAGYMKKGLISIIRCPECHSAGLVLKKKTEIRDEIRTGEVICKKCSLRMQINGGILNCIHNPGKLVLDEIKENESVAEKRKGKSDAWIISLPISDNFGNELHPEINKGYLKNVRFAIRKINLKGKRVLDIGAGTCWTTNLLAKEGADAVAADISSEKFIGLSSADVFMKHNRIYFERVLCSMDDLPFQDGSFDVILSNAAMHHSPNIKKTFYEISRLLKRGGVYIQTNEPVCSVFNLSRKIDIRKAREAGMNVADGWNEKTYTYFDYKRFMKKNGLKGRFIFPPSFSHILEDKWALEGIRGYKRLIGSILSNIWGLKPFRAILIALFPLSLVVFGGSFVLIAKKDG